MMWKLISTLLTRPLFVSIEQEKFGSNENMQKSFKSELTCLNWIEPGLILGYSKFKFYVTLHWSECSTMLCSIPEYLFNPIQHYETEPLDIRLTVGRRITTKSLSFTANAF